MALTFQGGDFSATTTITGTVGSVGSGGATVVMVAIYPKTATVSAVTSGWTLGKRINNSAGDGAQLVYYKNGANSASVVFTMSANVAGSWVTLSDTARQVKADSFTETQGSWGTWSDTKALSTTATTTGAAVIAAYSPSRYARKCVFPGNSLIVNQGTGAEFQPNMNVGRKDMATAGASGDIPIWPYEYFTVSPPTAATASGDEQWNATAFVLQSGSLPVAVISGTAEVNLVPVFSSTLPTPSISTVEDQFGNVFANGGSTSQSSLIARGTISAELGSGDKVEVYRNVTYIGTATVAGTTWSYLDGPLSPGTYTYMARVEDGLELSAFTTEYTVTVTAPAERPAISSGGSNAVRRPGSFSW